MSKITYGRRTIYSTIKEEELNEEKIKEVLSQAIPIHMKNKKETKDLYEYYLGKQDVLDRIKHTREEIKNIAIENLAYSFVNFKKGYNFGKPIQYVQSGDTVSEEITKLNDYFRYENKHAKDFMLSEDIYVCGRGFRYNAPDINEFSAEVDEAPFTLANIDKDKCEVVYSDDILKKQLLAFVEDKYEDTPIEVTTNRGKILQRQFYYIYNVYTKDAMYKYKVTNVGDIDIEVSIDNIEFIKKEDLYPKFHRIVEHYFNKSRISMIEIGKTLFDEVNNLNSLDMDDVEQFVNAIMVFTNAEVNGEEIEEIKALGAVNIASSDNKPAKVEILNQEIQAEKTQVLYDRLKNALHSLFGIPLASDAGTPVSGDTGSAKESGQGWTMANQKSVEDEIMFEMCDKEVLKNILLVCKEVDESGIKDLRASDIKEKFQKNKNDNLLVKTQALMNLKSTQIHPQLAMAVVDLFSDSEKAYNESKAYYGKDLWIEEQSKEEPIEDENNDNETTEKDDKKNPNDTEDTREQTNKVRATLENQKQNK